METTDQIKDINHHLSRQDDELVTIRGDVAATRSDVLALTAKVDANAAANDLRFKPLERIAATLDRLEALGKKFLSLLQKIAWMGVSAGLGYAAKLIIDHFL